MNSGIELQWAEFKAQINLGVPWKYFDISSNYYLFGVDGPVEYTCLIPKDSGANQTEFEASYKANAFTTLAQFDADGAMITRNKAAKRGWSYHAIGMEFSTSVLGSSLVCKDHTGADYSGISMKLYNDSDVEITTAGVLNTNLATAVKTVIDFEPAYDYELIGGAIRPQTTITDDLHLWIVAVPDIAAPTGSKVMASNLNMRYLSPGNVMEVDGRVSKYLTYNATYHTNKLRFIFKYPAGLTEQFQMVIEHYKA